MPSYKVNNDIYDIPSDKVEAFEKQYPDALLTYSRGNDIYDIPASKRKAFEQKFPDAVSLVWDNEQSTTSSSMMEDPYAMKEVPMFDDEPNATPGKPEAVRGFGAGASEGWKGLKAGFQNLWGETANIFTGSSQESIDALNELNNMVRQGKDVAAETEDAWTDVGRDIRTGAMELLPGWMIKGWKNKVLAKADKQKVLNDIREAIGEAGGDVDKARAILEQRAQDASYGDEQIKKAAEKFSDVKPTEGFGAWVGSNVVQMIPSASALIVGAVTKSPAAAKAIGMIGMGGMTAATAGTSMYEARQAGASDTETWKVGVTDGMIEYLTEKLPFDRYTSRVLGKIKGEVAQDLFSALRTNKATRAELEDLLIRANERLGGKLFSKKNLKDYVADMLAEGASEFSAEALQTMTSMMYEEPENYPTINEILTNGWEGAKAGFFMGAILGGASKTMEHAQNRQRRMEKGSVDVALADLGDGEKDVVEVVEYDADNNTAVVLHDGSLEVVSGDAISEGYRFSYEEFEKARLREMEDESIVSGNVADGQIQGLEENISKDIEEIRALAPEMTESEISAILQGERAVEQGTPLADAVAKYQEDVTRHDELVAAKRDADAARKEAVRSEIETAVGQRFWMQNEGEKDENGIAPVSEEVEEIVYADGRTAYVVGWDDAGNLTLVYTDGTKGFSSRSEITNKLNSGEIVSDTPMGLDEYLESKIQQSKIAEEKTRIAEEHALSIEEMIATHPQDSVINLGTEEEKIEVPIIAPPTKDGVIVQMPDGTTPLLRWEDVAHAEKKELTPKTNAQINQSIADEYRVAYTPAARPSQPIQQAEEQVKRTSAANPLPTKADGTVDQTALWNKDPERWAEWNDEQRQDGGANSLAYVSGAIAKEQAKIAELQAAYAAESDFDARDIIEKEIADTQARVARLTAIQQGYIAHAEAAVAPAPNKEQIREERKRAALRERAAQWEKLTGVRINLIESEEDLTDPDVIEQIRAGKQVKGWARGGQAYIYLPYAESINDVDETCIHEVVAHVGLKALLGQEEFDKFLDRVWDIMSESDRKKFLAYPGVNGNTRAAADEYVAHMAERMSLKEVATREEKSGWEKIVSFVKEALRNLGLNISITDQEIADLIKESYANLRKNKVAAGQAGQTRYNIKPKSAARMALDIFAEDMTMEEIKTGVANEVKVTKERYEQLLNNPPKIQEGESLNDYKTRKQEYSADLEAAKTEYDFRIEMQKELDSMNSVEEDGTVSGYIYGTEGAVLAEEVNQNNLVRKLGITGVDYAFTANNFYVFENENLPDYAYSNGEINTIFGIAIAGNEDAIEIIKNEIEYGIIEDSETLDSAIEEIRNAQAENIGNNASSTQERGSNEGDDSLLGGQPSFRIADNSESSRDVQDSSEGTEITTITDFAKNEKPDIRFNIATEDTLEEQIRAYANSAEGKKAGWTEEKIESIIKETRDLINAIHNSNTGNEFYDDFAVKDPTIRLDWRDGVDKPIVTWTRANIEYKYDMSADLLCINNEGLEAVLSSDKMVALMEMFIPEKKAKKGEPAIKFTADDYLELYNTLKDLGFVVPCKGCFDAAGRFKMLPSVAQKFAAEVNAVIAERNKDPKKFDEKLKAKSGEKTASGLPATSSTKSDAIAVGVAGDNLTEPIKWTQLMSADGQTKMLSDWGGIFRAWQRTGAGRPKDKLLPEPYYGDIVSSHTTIIGAYGESTPSFRDILVNTGTGLRRNSHSEFRPVLAVDEIQFMRDAFIRNLTVFKYMKELDDVRLFGKMGVKYNMSFFPEYVPGTKAAGLDLDGNYIASEESVGSREFPYFDERGVKHYDGMRGFEEAQKHINKDVSLSSVILSIPHLLKSLTDVPTPSDMRGIWGSLIPFHSSGATSSSLAAQGLGLARANGVGHGFEEAMYDYGRGVTNFEAVQNDRFGKGWEIISGKKAGTKVEEGHKLEFANGTHYYNRDLGVHLFASGYILDSELPEGVLMENGDLNIDAEQKKSLMHKFKVDYNDKVRELATPYAYKEAADFYLSELPKIGLVPRFDFTVEEPIFLQMCADANVDPRHPKLGWKGEGNGWSPIDSEAYYSLFCDFGMTDPATGEWSPHNPVGVINENGEREFRLPENAVEIVREGLERFSEVRRVETGKIDEAIKAFATRSVEKGRISKKDAEKVVGELRMRVSNEGPIDLVEEARKAQARHDAKESDVRFRVLDTTKAELKEKPIKLNGMYRFNLKNAFKGVKDNGGSYPYIKVQLEEVSDDYSGEKIVYNGILEGFAVVRIPKGLITEGEKDNEFFIDPKAIEKELWDVLRATENYYEFKHGGAPYQRDWLNGEEIRFRMSNENQAIFVSNAAKAVEGIKQEKTTPEQWLKMIEKNGGLKAGEDKWMGLSDWLKASDKKTLTKQEVLDFINENMIQIEEVHYTEDEDSLEGKRTEIQEALQSIFDEYVAESEDMNDDMFMSTHYNYAIEKLAEELGYQAWNAPFLNNNAIVELDFYDDDLDTLIELSNKLGIEKYDGTKTIDSTRRNYTTSELTNLHEIALTVPTIESWNENDEIHFGDAGDGRAVAWIRFGETEVPTGEYKVLLDEMNRLKEVARELYEEFGGRSNELAEVEERQNELRAEMRSYKNPGLKVLVIDEIQSKRHQEGREKGYISTKVVEAKREAFEKASKPFFAYEQELREKYDNESIGYIIDSELKQLITGEEYLKYDNLRKAYDDARLDYRNPRYDAIPDAPFDKNWHELAMKRMLRYAAENGYDVVAWTTGDQQADRYDLSRDVKKISASKPTKDGERIVNIYYRDEYNDFKNLVVDKEGKVVQGDYSGNALADVIGKEMALQIMKAEESTEFKGDGLKIGGEGMRGFYDKMLPAFMNKYGKKWGVKVEDIDLPNLGKSGRTMHSIPVTEEMKASVMEGQVMFRVRGENESTEEFIATEIPRFQGSYNVNAPIVLMDYSSKESAARSLGIDVKDMPDYMYDNIKELAKENGGAYVKELNTILIFAQDYITTSGKADNVFFHEGAHSFITENPHWLKLGEWLLDNAASGTKKKIADVVRMAYEEDEYVEEMLTGYTGLMLSLGRSQAVMNSLPTEMKPIWEEILNKFNYIPEYEDTRRKSERAGDEDARRDAGVSMRNTDGEKAVRKGKISWKQPAGLTSKERRIINEFFPGAFPEEENDTQPDNTGEFSEGEGDIRFSIRTKPAPKKTGKGYKVFYLKNGKLYPPMVANLGGVDTLVGVWLDAEEGTRAGVSKTGRPKVKQGGKGTQGGSGTLAYRPGWHLGEIPYAIQFNRKDENGDRTLFPADFVWAEVEYANDVDYQEEAMSYGMNANGKFQHSLAGLPKIPTDGSYKYRTNPNPETDPWIITGSMKVNRLLTPSEVDQMVIDAGREPQKRQEGAVTDAQIEELNKELGLMEEEEEVSFRVTGTPTEDVVAEGVSLSPAQLASLAGDIFAALPEESRKKITDGLNGNILGLQDAILQIPTSLATKEDWNDEDKQMAEVVAEQMTKAVGIEMTRPFSASEALWTLYNAVNKSTDLVSEASRALVRRNLGFDSQTLEMEKEAKDGVRFRTVGNASDNAQASMYNRGAANVWTRLKESYVDMHASVEELVKAIEKRSGKVAQGFENILMALNQQSSKGLAAMEAYEQKFLNKMFDAIRKIMDKTDFKYEDIVRYVILKHGLERNVKMAQRDAKAHYQEIYDEILSLVRSLDDAQKRTYLTNAHLKRQDALAKLATLKAVDTTSMTEDEKAEHKKNLAKAHKAVEEAEQHLFGAEKVANLSEAEVQKELDDIFKSIESGKNTVYQEMRKNDYSGISSMFYDTLGVDRKKYATEEEYQSALMQAKADKYDNLGDIEGAAQMEVTLFEKAVNTDNLWKRINAATKETLRQQYEANMISKDQYDNLRNMFEFYVPLRGFKDNTAEDMYTYYRRPNSTGYTKPILGAEGRKTEAESPFGWIAAMAGSAIASNVKNEAKLALYYFVANRPDNGIATLSKTWFVHTPGDVDANGKKIFRPAYPSFNADLSTDAAKQAYEDWQEQMRDLQKQGLAYESGQRLNLGNSVVNISDTNKPEHIVNVKVGGKDYTIVINGNPRAAQAINGDLNIEGTSQDYSALFGPVLRWMSSVNTSYNPEFWITNMMRDMAFTMMAVNIKEDPAYRRKFFKNYAKAFKVVSMVAKNENGSLGNSYIEQQYKDFVKYGGVTGHTQIKDSETWEKEIENYLASNDPASIRSGKVMRGMKTVFHAAHIFGESLEQVSRFAAFLTAVETGKSINEAINDAKEITVNFNRKGSGKMITLEEAKYLTDNNGQPLNKFEQWAAVGLSSIAPLGRRFIMFFNAAIQGLNATYKLYAKNKTRAIGWALGYAAVGMMNAVLHAMLDDDDDYLDIPQYERRNSLMIGGNGAYFKWALPQEARAFYALGDLAVESVMGRNPHQSVIGEALKISTEILPVNPSKGWKAFMPSVAIPFVELVLNEDYKGAPIYNEQKWLTEEERERSTKWSKAYQGTGDLYVGIAKGLNAISGGDEHDAGLINLQPEKMQHIVQSAFGGTIKTADKLFTTIMAAFDPEEDITARQFPFLNRFLTINDERFKNVHVNDVYDYYAAEAEHTISLQKKYTKDRNADALKDLRSSDEFKWARIYSKYKKPIKKYQEAIRAADTTNERMELMKQQDELKRKMIKEISEL